MTERAALRLAGNLIALFVAAWVLPGIGYGNRWWALVLAAVVFTIVNALVKPVIAVLSIPLIVVTLGVAYLLINVLMLYLTHWIVPQLQIRSFGWAVLAALIVSLVNGLLHLAIGRERRWRLLRWRARNLGAGRWRGARWRGGRWR